MNKEDGWNKLALINQTSLLRHWDGLKESEKKSLLKQISQLDIVLFKKQQSLLLDATRVEKKEDLLKNSLVPFHNYSCVSDSDEEKGRQMLLEGKVGSLLIAGGQGSRLRFNGPKGLFPVSIIQKKSLFQLYAEKILAASRQLKRTLPVAIMTSLDNDQATQSYFAENNYFGLSAENVSFFHQGVLPFLNLEGNLFLEEVGKIAEGPDGNGSVFDAFNQSGLWDKWQKAGIQYVTVVLIDNPLADPLDAYLVGNHCQHQATVTVKCIERKNEHEKVGLLVEREGKIQVIEYSELSEEERGLKDTEGRLTHRCANMSLFCFSLAFMKEVTIEKPLPLHLACKSVKQLDALKEKAWKFEKFIFDALLIAPKVRALLYPREWTFAPLKNFEGEDSLETVQALLQKRDQEIFFRLTGTPPSEGRFELAQEFYYPTEELKKKWKGASLPPSSYILP